MKSFRRLIAFVSLILLSFSVAEAVEYRRIGQDYRSLAMGNTGIVSANNSAALFYNPATLANIFSWWVDIFVQLVYSDDLQKLMDYMNGGDFSLETRSDQEEFMDKFIGKNPYLKADLGLNGFANISKKGLTIGGNYTYELTVDVNVRNPSTPAIDAFGRVDYIRQMGASLPIGLGKLIVGLVYKTVERTEIDFTYDTNDMMNEADFPTLKDDGHTGYGAGYDIGFLYRTATPAHIMFGGVYRTEIKLDNVTTIPEEYAFGIGNQLEYGIFRIAAAMDFRDVTNQQGSESDNSYNKRLHYGVELGFFPIDKSASWLSARLGYNQGYLSTGVELNLYRNLILGLTNYVEETGEYAGQKSSSRTVLYVALGF